MAIAARTPGAWAAGTTSVTPPMPTGNAAGDINVIFVGCKPFNATIVVPTGWTLVTGGDGNNGSTASGIDTGSVLWKSMYREWQSGDTAPVVSVTGGGTALGYMGGFSKAADRVWGIASAKGSDTTSGTGFSLTTDANPGIITNDFLVHGAVIAGNNATFGTPTITATSATIGAVTESPAAEGTTALGDDLEASAATATCTAGAASAAPVAGWTLSVAQTGGGNVVRLREVATSVLTGTITAAVTEADIVTGGKTLIITLTGDTWIAAGAASFDLQRQNIINGITSAQAETLGWNLVPKALQGVAGVVRTSATVVTITWDAFPTYDITATETVTVTVPATALTGAVAIVATPTFAVTATATDDSATKFVNMSDSRRPMGVLMISGG